MIIYVVVLALILSWVLSVFGVGKVDMSYSQLVSLFRDEKVKSFVVSGETIKLSLHTPY